MGLSSSFLLDKSAWGLGLGAWRCAFPLSTSVEFHKFYDVLFSLVLNYKYFLCFLLIALLTCRCLNVLFSFQIFEYFPEIFRTMTSDLIPYEQRIYFVWLNIFKSPKGFVLQYRIYLYWLMFCVYLKKRYMYSAVGYSVFWMSTRSSEAVMSLKSSIFLLIVIYLCYQLLRERERYGNLWPCVHLSILLTVLSIFAWILDVKYLGLHPLDKFIPLSLWNDLYVWW